MCKFLTGSGVVVTDILASSLSSLRCFEAQMEETLRGIPVMTLEGFWIFGPFSSCHCPTHANNQLPPSNTGNTPSQREDVINESSLMS